MLSPGDALRPSGPPKAATGLHAAKNSLSTAYGAKGYESDIPDKRPSQLAGAEFVMCHLSHCSWPSTDIYLRQDFLIGGLLTVAAVATSAFICLNQAPRPTLSHCCLF